MKKKNENPDKELAKIYREATQKDIDIWTEARNKEEIELLFACNKLKIGGIKDGDSINVALKMLNWKEKKPLKFLPIFC